MACEVQPELLKRFKQDIQGEQNINRQNQILYILGILLEFT